MQMRYRYRIEPTATQQWMLGRVFGCCRVVFNDALRVRDEAYRAGVRLSDCEIQRRVITQAKTIEQRAWLCEVPSVLLVAKVGELGVRWSRDLPSQPSSVTIIREPDGHYYASFVVDVASTPFPPAEREAGVDVGIARLATIAATDGTRVDVHNPKHLGRKQRKLARLEREKSRRQKGSANRDKTRRKVAVAHNEVARARRDYHHKQALALVRENQVIHVEDLNIVGMVKNRRLARAISDAGWSQLVRIIGEKADRYGRSLRQVSRWLASSKTCSACGHRLDELPLQVRQWTCPQCAAVHDRDHNAAKVILAAGRAERQNACGAAISPPTIREARGDEAGSTPTAA